MIEITIVVLSCLVDWDLNSNRVLKVYANFIGVEILILL